MKKTLKTILCLVLSALLILPMGVMSFAEIDYEKPFRITCSVNGDTKTQRGFCWYTKDECDTKIEIFDSNDDDVAVVLENVQCEKWEDNYMHKVLVKGLKAGETYSYRVGDGFNWSQYGEFKTDDGDANVNLLVIADVQASNLDNFKKGSRATKKGISMLENNVDALITLGDFTNDSTNEEWDFFDEAFNEINLSNTNAPVTGNHDGFGVSYWFNNMFNLNTDESVQIKNGVNYSYDIGNVHIAVLNSNDIVTVSNAQLDWLRKDMNKSSADWKIVTVHKSAYTLGKDGKWPDALYLQGALGKVCDEINVDLVLSGHDHQYLRTKPIKNGEASDTGTRFILCGTAGSKRYEVRPFLVDTFTETKIIDRMVSQKDGHYFDGKNFESQDYSYIGSCFNTIKVNGGSLTFESYVINDLSEDNTEDVVTVIDSFTIEKEQGKNVATETGANNTSKFSYIISAFTSVMDILQYIFSSWLPKFVRSIPAIAKSYFVDDIF